MESSVVGNNQPRRKRNVAAGAAPGDQQLNEGPPKLQKMVGNDDRKDRIKDGAGAELDVQQEKSKKGQNVSSPNAAVEDDPQLGTTAADDGLTYTVIEVMDVPQGVTPQQLSVYVDDQDELVVQAEHPGTVALGSEDDVYGEFDVPDEVKIAIDEAMSYAKMNKGKEPIFRRAIAELLTTTASVSSTWRKYKINHITLTKYFRMASEFLKGEMTMPKKAKRAKPEMSSGPLFRRVLQVPASVCKETVKCYFEPWDSRLTITAAVLPQEELDRVLEAEETPLASTSKVAKD